MSQFEFTFFENKPPGMLIFRGGSVTALVPQELKYNALCVLYVYMNRGHARALENEISNVEFVNPFWGMPEEDLIDLTTALKKEILDFWSKVNGDRFFKKHLIAQKNHNR